MYRTPDKHLEMVGIKNKEIIRNPTISELYEYALLPYHKKNFNQAVRDSWLTNRGALVAYSGNEWEEFLTKKELFAIRILRRRYGGVHLTFHSLLKATKLFDKEQLITLTLEKEFLSSMAGVAGMKDTD